MYPAFDAAVVAAGLQGFRARSPIMAAHLWCDDGAECSEAGPDRFAVLLIAPYALGARLRL